MKSEQSKGSNGRWRIWMVAAALGAALAGGLLTGAGRLEWAVVPVAAAAVWLWPGAGVALFVALAAGVVPGDPDLAVRTAWGGFQLTDLLLLLLMCRTVAGRRAARSAGLPLEAVALFLICTAVVGAAHAILLRATPPRPVLSELRPFGYLAVAFVVSRVELPTTWRRWWGTLIVAVGALVATAALLQHLQGTTLGLPRLGQRVRYLETIEGTGVIRLARVQAQGTPFVILALFYCVARVGLGARLVPLWLGLTGFLGLQMILTFSRNLWVSAALGLAALVASLPARVLRTVVAAATAAAALGLFAMMAGRVTATEYLRLDQVVTERVVSLFQAKTMKSTQVQGRLAEVQRAWPSIASNWAVGIGPGTPYLEYPIWGQGEALSYLHNGYVAVMLKMGVVGILASLAVVLVAFAEAWKLRLGPNAAWGSAVCGFVAVLAASSIVSPRFLEPEWMAALGVVIGMLTLAGRPGPQTLLRVDDHGGGASPREGGTGADRSSARAVAPANCER